MNILIIFITSYLIGTIHPAYILTKIITKEDIRKSGTYNSGASNAIIKLGLKFGILVGIIDILKGVFVVLITKYFYDNNINLMYFAGASAVIGHVFPFHMKFQGGKGLATLGGIYIAINPLWALGGTIVFLAISFITNYIVIGTITVSIGFVILTYLKYGISYPFYLSLFIAILILLKHRVNYIKIWKKEEYKFRDVFIKK